jgi:hypothetical protein
MSRNTEPTLRWRESLSAAFITFAEAAEAASLETDR